MNRQDEFDLKAERLRAFLQKQGARGALLATHANFAWVSAGGRNHVSTTTERGSGAILVTADGAYLLADNIEHKRLEEEELAGLTLEPREYPWWSGNFTEAALRLVPAGELISDVPVPGAKSFSPTDLLELRNPLLPSEMERYRALGRDAAIVLTHAALHCRPGLSEHQLAGILAGRLTDFGITPAVVLVAVDERIYTRRHPIPTDKRLDKYVMLVVGGRREGLNLSATRLVHFGPIPTELQDRHAACARVDAAVLAATTPGSAISEVFDAGAAAYAAEGYPGEWQHHHQGGPTGYAGRDMKGAPGCSGTVQLHQAFAWNPSIAGTKSEDTVLVTEAGVEVISVTPDLPVLKVEAAGREFLRPAILQR